jgi:cell division protein FtsW
MNRHVNYFFLALSLFLIIFGLLFLSTLSAIASLQVFGNTNYYLLHQLVATAIGLVLGFIAYKTPLPFIKKVAPILFWINFVLLIVAAVPILGTKFWGASRWISIGSHTFQPSEFFKITASLYFSSWISGRVAGHTKKNWVAIAKRGYDNLTRLFIPFLILLVLIAGTFYLQRDISTLGIVSVTLLAIYFIAGTPLWNTLLMLIMGMVSAAFLVIKEPYRLDRLLVFLHPNADPLGKGLQLKQSLIAMGSGGLFGKGLGMSTQKFGFLPQAMSDSIVAIIGEELGIVGCIALVVLFLLFLWLGFRISKHATDMFAKLIAVGIPTWIVLQAFLNIASSMGLFPLSGIPLPFFSYGGSHIIAEIIGVGLLLNISKNG